MASTFTTPLDVIKTRIMVERGTVKKTIKQVFNEIIAQEGYKGLFKGV